MNLDLNGSDPNLIHMYMYHQHLLQVCFVASNKDICSYRKVIIWPQWLTRKIHSTNLEKWFSMDQALRGLTVLLIWHNTIHMPVYCMCMKCTGELWSNGYLTIFKTPSVFWIPGATERSQFQRWQADHQDNSRTRNHLHWKLQLCLNMA